MRVRKHRNLIVREEQSFGGLCYVAHRDDFFAANQEVFHVIKNLSEDWTPVRSDWEETYVRLAYLGLCETQEPTTAEKSFSGVSFLGTFQEIPAVEQPMVVNCFCTAHCPLRCMYCHADDLMQQYRREEWQQSVIEVNRDLRNVISTASQVPALVAVITGGDPLTQPDRAIRLIEGLSSQKALVLDTSGVGDIDQLLPFLLRHKVHVRVSLDSCSIRDNDKWRPVNLKSKYDYYGNTGVTSSTKLAMATIDRCIESGLPVTVQTVVHSSNDRYQHFKHMREGLMSIGVKHWVLHIAVKGGRVRQIEELVDHDLKTGKRKIRRGSLLPRPDVRQDLWRLISDTRCSASEDGLNIDIRCTDTNATPNSVLLINSRGSLFTEGYAHNGKVRLYDVNEDGPDRFSQQLPHFDKFGHARRYLNWNPWYYNGQNLEDICYEVPIPYS